MICNWQKYKEMVVPKEGPASAQEGRFGNFELKFTCFVVAGIDQLCSEGRIAGSIQGRQDKAVFVPDIYSKTQTSWIDDFFKQNGYIGKNQRYSCNLRFHLETGNMLNCAKNTASK